MRPRSITLLGITLAAAIGACAAAVQAPILKWHRGGCFSSWCQTGWYSSPAARDLDGNGTVEVVGAAYDVFALDGATGAPIWRVASGHDRSEPTATNVGRTWPGVVIADVDADGQLEVVTAHGAGYVSVYDRNGYFKPGWPKRPTTYELRGLAVYDVDNDGTLEIAVSGALPSATNTWVYEHDGTLRPGWPQITGTTGYAWGVYNDNLAIGNLDADAAAEILVPSDVHYLAAYEANTTQVAASATFGSNKKWSQVGVYESPIPEQRGWAMCDGTRAESYRTNFATGAGVIADVNGDGVQEVVVTGTVYDCSVEENRYTGVYIFRTDRTRFQSGSWDWTHPPVDTGAPLSEDYLVIESAMPDPVVADLDGDGVKEILFSANDGRVHAFWLDRTQHGAWPYSVYSATEGVYRYPSPPVVADLDNDGQAEVIFTSWPQVAGGSIGKLHILDSTGHALWAVSLPAWWGSGTWNGALAAPTLADIDGDPDLEIVVNTSHSGLVAYDLPGSASARVLWSTGRGNPLRSGSCLTPAPPALGATVRVAQSGSNDLRITWQAQPGATGYSVYRATGPGMTGAVRVGRVPGTSFVDVGARTSTAPRFNYQVRAISDCSPEGL